MAVRRKIAETPVWQPPVMVDQPKKSMWEKAGPVMGVLLIVAAFALGSMWTKMKYLEKGTPTAPAAAGVPAAAPSKYKNLAEAVKDYSKQIGIDGNKLVSCMTEGGKKSVVDADTAEGTKAGVQGTPAFYINGRFLGGAYPFESFKQIIDEELSGNPK